jgi:hypothetical protein
MSAIVTINNAGVLWDNEAYHKAPTHIRMRLKCTEPAILVDEKDKIVAANNAWQDQCGFREEAIGSSPKILQGALTDQAKALRFTNRVLYEGRAGTSLINYRADGSPFLHTIVANKLDGFFIAKTTRAVGLRAGLSTELSTELFTISVALVLTPALVLTFTALSTIISRSEAKPTDAGSIAWGFDGVSRAARLYRPTVDTSPSTVVSDLIEATPLAACFLLAILVVVMERLITMSAPAHSVDRKPFTDSVLVGLAATVSVPVATACMLMVVGAEDYLHDSYYA